MEVGIDLVKKDRFINVDNYFINRVYTKEELFVYNKLDETKKVDFLSSRWAVKEAIFKANGSNNYLHYSILNDDKGKPFVLNEPKIKISISHDGDYVIAIAVIE